MGPDQLILLMGEIVFMATRTFTLIRFANPLLECESCRELVTGYVDDPWMNWPCRHRAGVHSRCPSWGPVDGCTCEKGCS